MTHTKMDTEGTAATSPDLLQQYLAQTDAPCPGCGYNLRALTGDACPECGEQLTLRVELTEPKLAAFITGLVGLAASAGFSGLLVLYGLRLSFYVNRHMPDEWFPITVGGFVASTVLVLLWCRMRRWHRQRSSIVRWMTAMVCCMVPIMNLILFVAFFPR